MLLLAGSPNQCSKQNSACHNAPQHWQHGLFFLFVLVQVQMSGHAHVNWPGVVDGV
jgi:hypothetical protein